MNARYELKVNGVFLTNVEADETTSLDQFKAFAATFKPDFNAALDTLEVLPLDAPKDASMLLFRTNAYMQQFGLGVSLDNIIAAYRLDAVYKYLEIKRIA